VWKDAPDSLMAEGAVTDVRVACFLEATGTLFFVPVVPERILLPAVSFWGTSDASKN
jgi:hypothetical protein